MNTHFFDPKFHLNEENFNENKTNEFSTHLLIKMLSESYLKEILSNDSKELEEMDVMKASSLIRENFNLELPLYLKNYIESEKFSEKQFDSIFIKLGKEGIKYFGSIFENSELKEVFAPSVSVRHSNIPLNEVLILEENGSSEITYQLLRENEKEVYLSLKLTNLDKPKFDQVIIKKDNRFIYSKSFDLEGQISFSGLVSGKYNIELLGKSNSKRFDLSLLTE